MISRRRFAWGLAAAWTEAAMAQRALVGTDWPPDTVWLNANENPAGVPAVSLEAIAKVSAESWRYHFPEFRAFYATVAASERLEPSQVLIGAGSTEVLNVAVAAFTSDTRPVIVAEPTFESPAEMAGALGRKAVRVPLTASWAADVKRMAQEAEKAGGGLIYVCNPNNPTSSLTPRQDIKWLVDNLPKNTVLLVDEAYLHFVDNYQEHSALDYVRQGKDVVVTRTFSKIYGMAGLRVGFAAAPPDLMRPMRPYRNHVISIVGARAVAAALAQADTIIPDRRAKLSRVRADLCQWLRRKNLKFIEPHANFVMIETGRNAWELGVALQQKHVAVGRPFPPLEKMLRVTIGTEQDMTRFKAAFEQVMA